MFPNDRWDKNCQVDKIPEDRFPVYLTLTLSQWEASAVRNIRETLTSYAKDQVRYRTGKNLYCNSIEFRCYFNDPEELGRFCREALAGFYLVRTFFLEKEERRTPQGLCEEAWKCQPIKTEMQPEI